jgi:hypothetical protein
MIIIYHGRRPYPPLLACALHLGLLSGAEPFLPGGLRRDWRAAPLLVAGADRGGATVCCLVHGRHGGLYRRALIGMAAVFGLSLAFIDLDRRLSETDIMTRTGFLLAGRWPALFERRFRPAAVNALRPGLPVS